MKLKKDMFVSFAFFFFYIALLHSQIKSIHIVFVSFNSFRLKDDEKRAIGN